MTLASKITMIRVAFIPLYMVLMYMSKGQSGLWMWLALAVFIIASITDWLDGMIARKYNQTTYRQHRQYSGFGLIHGSAHFIHHAFLTTKANLSIKIKANLRPRTPSVRSVQ